MHFIFEWYKYMRWYILHLLNGRFHGNDKTKSIIFKKRFQITSAVKQTDSSINKVLYWEESKNNCQPEIHNQYYVPD